MLVSSNINSKSRIVLNRNIEHRVRKIMPMLHYESDPYMVAVDGKLYWIVDAYSCTALIIFPIAVTVLAGLIAPSSLALIGFFMFGNLICEYGVLNSLVVRHDLFYDLFEILEMPNFKGAALAAQ